MDLFRKIYRKAASELDSCLTYSDVLNVENAYLPRLKELAQTDTTVAMSDMLVKYMEAKKELIRHIAVGDIILKNIK